MENKKIRAAKGTQLKGEKYKLKTKKNLIINKKGGFWELC